MKKSQMFTFLDCMKKNPKTPFDKFCGFAMTVINNRSLWGSTGSSGGVFVLLLLAKMFKMENGQCDMAFTNLTEPAVLAVWKSTSFGM